MLGQTFLPSNTCATDTMYLQTVSSGPSYAAPSSGVITSWSYQADSAPPASIKLKVGRVPPGTDLSTNANITVVGESTSQVPTANTLNDYPTQIPVQAGDFIGFYLGPTGFDPGCENLDNSFRNQYSSDVAPGATAPFSDEGGALDLAAVLEPDCDHDGLGDETQDPNTSSCNPPAGPTGQRAAALASCRKRAHKHHWSHKRLKKCKKHANSLPA
jgi:hypothetical protein